MKNDATLLVSGFGTTINVDKKRLIIHNPHTKETLRFDPHQIEYDMIVLDGHTGNISFEAMRWLTRHNIHLTLLDWNGNLLGSWTPKETNMGRLRVKQYQAYDEPDKRYSIARHIVDTKINAHLGLLKELSRYYEEVDYNKIEKVTFDIRADYEKSVKGTPDYGKLLFYEGRAASAYWDCISRVFKKLAPSFNFHNRCNMSNYHNNNASDEINALLNYGYALLESQCRRCINISGLDPAVGFLHEMQPGKTPLAYDIQELYRWIIDLAIIQVLADKKLKKSDFITTDHYHTRLREKSAKLLLESTKCAFNTRETYKKKQYTYQNILQDNVQKLANYLLDKHSVFG